MTKSELLNKAVDYIARYDTTSIICETLTSIPEENMVCANTCIKDLGKECVLRFLKYYKPPKGQLRIKCEACRHYNPIGLAGGGQTYDYCHKGGEYVPCKPDNCNSFKEP